MAHLPSILEDPSPAIVTTPAKAEPVLLWHPTAGFLDYGFTFGAVGFCYCEIALGLCMYEDMRHKEDSPTYDSERGYTGNP